MTPQEFIAGQLHATQAELSTAILNRGRWDRLREDRQLLLFLQEQVDGAPARDLRVELQQIADGSVRVPALTSSRAKAADCLRRWATDLVALR